MQIVDALEPVRRGYYCGAVGWIDADAQCADLAVAIRTFVVSPKGVDLGVGGGIVADSTAAGEWAETELKAARLLELAGAYEHDGQPARAGDARTHLVSAWRTEQRGSDGEAIRVHSDSPGCDASASRVSRGAAKPTNGRERRRGKAR
jgi:hypothetical protein